MSDVNAKAIKYMDCPTCGAKRKNPCHVIRVKPGWDPMPDEVYSGTWFVHWLRKEPLMDEFWRGVAYGRRLAMNDRAETLL